MEDIALEEKLDELDPLRHLRNDDDIVPVQPKSVHNETLDLSFPTSPHGLPQAVAIRLAVDASPGCGGIAWPAGQVLSSYIARRGSLKGKSVLELGSGTGLVGLVAAALGANVVITDQAGEALPRSLPRFDLVLAADCVYFEPAFPLLVQTLEELADRQGTERPELLFCYKKRRKADKRFFTMLKKKFSWGDVSDDPDKEVYSKDAISLLRLERR
ncbi:hypothetical protein EIP86_003152 [Pleurotus ostreatoroseus]|nr:hypothetical protein EIP86_003152 [Pleurotus ostreatoroseus]